MADSYSVTIQAKGEIPLNSCQVALPVTIKHGRSGIGTQPDPPALSFTWLSESLPFDLGDSIDVYVLVLYEAAVYDDPVIAYDDPGTLYSGSAYRARHRFSGYVVGIRASEVAGYVQTWDIECVGLQARTGRFPVTTSRPVESDVARVNALATAAGVSVAVQGTPGWNLVAKVYEGGDLLEALHEVCVSSGGLLWQEMTGGLVYGAADHRQVAEAAGVLPCEAIEDGLDWKNDQEQIVNSVEVEYGPEASRAKVLRTDDTSIPEAWGLQHVAVSSMCAITADAAALGSLIVARRAWPFWTASDVVVDALALDAPAGRALADIDVSDVVLVPFTADPGETPSPLRQAVVEGWVESWTSSGHTVQVALSDFSRWVSTHLRTWEETRAETWGHWKTGSYLDLLNAVA